MSTVTADTQLEVSVNTRFRRMPPLFPVQNTASADAAHRLAKDELSDGPIEDVEVLEDILLSFYEAQRAETADHPSDGDRQRSCDEAHGHVLQVQHNGIIKCRDCNAEWRDMKV